MTTPDQPTGMNELRELLGELQDANVSSVYPNVTAFYKAEAAIQQLVERCIPAKRRGDIRFGTNGERTFHESDYDQGCNFTIAKIRHNFQQAGLLRGDES